MESHSVYIGNCVDLKGIYTKCGKTSNFINRRGQLQTGYPLNEFVPYIMIMCNNEVDEDNNSTETEAEKIARLGARPTSYTS